MSYRARLDDELFRDAGPNGPGLYVVLDAARDDRTFRTLIDSGLPQACLYDGKIPDELASAAPYLLKLRPGAPILDELTHHWGESWGIFVASEAALETVRRELRRLLKVRDERGHTLLFRWYDPRVMRVYLPTCDARELGLLFGRVTRFAMEGEEPGTLLRYSYDGSALRTEELSLA